MEAPKHGRATRRLRAWLPAVPPALFLLAASVFWFSHVPRERDAAIEGWKKDLGLKADFRRDSLNAFLNDALVDASLLASFPAVQGVLRGSGGHEHAHFQEIVEQFRRVHAYDLVAVFDVSGRPAAGLPAPASDAGCVAAARGVIGAGMPAVSLHAHERGEPSLTLAAPIRGDAGNPLGAVLIVTGPSARLYPLLGEPFSPRTGEALLVARDGADVVYLSPLRRRPGAPLAFRRPLDTEGFAAREALQRPESVGLFTDYRGEQVVAATRRLTAAPWGLVVKVDESEALEPFWLHVRDTALVWGVALLGVLALAWGIGQRLRRLRADANTRGESRFRTLFEQASDAVFIVGEDGLVQDANRAAEESYRAPREALIGRHVADFRPPEQRKTGLAFFETATRVDRLVFEGEHLRADGSRFPVEVSTRRAEMPGGPVHISIVRDVSGRRNVDARVRHLNRLLHTIIEINQLIVRTDERATLLGGACQILVELGGFALVWVGLADRTTGRVVPVARAGHDEGYVDEIEVRCDDSPLGRGPVGTAIRTGRRTVITDVSADVRVEPWRARQIARGFRLVAAFPLKSAGTVSGALTIYSRASDVLGDEECSLLDELAADLAFALDAIQDRAERARVEVELRTSDEALRKSERRFRGILENMQDAYFQTDREGRFVLLSPSAPRMYGYASLEEMIGLSAADLYFDPEERASVLEELRRSGRTYDRVGKGKKKDGTPFWVSLSAGVVRDGQGRVTGTEGLIRDISDRARVEEALRANEARLRSLFDGMLEGYAHCEMHFEQGVGVDWVFLDVNPAFERLTGLKGVVGRRVTDVLPNLRQTNPEEFEIYGRVASTGMPETFEDRVPELERWYTVSAYSPRKGEFVTVFQDVTVRKQAEERLAKSELYFRSIIENSLDITVVLAPDTRLLFVSPAAEALFGYRPADMQGSAALDLIHPGDRQEVETAFRRVLADGSRVEQTEFRVRRRDGSWRTLSAMAKLLAPETGMHGVIVNGRDISDRRQLEAQLAQAQKMEAVGRLAGGVAHDFNNLLTVIAGYAELLNETLAENREDRESVGEILKAAGRATSLTRQLLAFSRRQILETRVLDVGAVVAETEKMLRRLIGEDLELVVVRPAGLGHVKADAGQVEQILLNLAVNARDAMPDGGRLVIELENVHLREPLLAAPEAVPAGRYVLIAVTDTGTGMDAETLGHVFEPFFTTKEKGKGTGLGLATVYGIVRQSGGYVTAASSPGAGTTFRIYLPHCDEPAISGVRPAVGSHVGKETVLLVEDEPAVRSLARTVLGRHGYTVLVAENGAAALDVVDRDPRQIHVLLTDLVMPGMNGRDLASTVLARRPSIKIIFMSGYAADVETDFVADGTAAFLSKPFSERSLTAKVREILDTRPA
ncbi:MAG TPA: PAS domain S-box protein [Thermoanaerobaculia bacterium]|jgi:PAS domain S-box-containing protein